MDNGELACSYAKRYCGNQYVATDLNGATVPTCFSPTSTTCLDWNKKGCDLSRCDAPQEPQPPVTPPIVTIFSQPPTTDSPSFAPSVSTPVNEPVLGCDTPCFGLLMDNGEPACSYAKRYCGSQYVATDLNGATIPTCFSPSSTTCLDWNRKGCDLSRCYGVFNVVQYNESNDPRVKVSANPTLEPTMTPTKTPTLKVNNKAQPVLGCRTSCSGVLMDNGQEACSYAKRYCGNKYVATNLRGAKIPMCFPRDSTLCMDWRKEGCDLSQCT